MSVGISTNYVNIQSKPVFCGVNPQKWKSALKYIELCPNSPVSKDFVEDMAEGILAMGYIGEKIIKANKLKYKLAQKASDAFPSLIGKHPQGWPKDATWDNCGALSYSGKVGLFENPVGNEFTTINAVWHETGHELYRTLKKKEDFTKAFLKDIKNLPQNLEIHKNKVKRPDYYIDYVVQGSTPQKATLGGKAETFAEIFAKLMGGSVQERFCKGTDNLYDGIFPDTIAYIKDLLHSIGKK